MEMPARIVVILDEMRAKVHHSRIHEGTRFRCCEGRMRVAEGRVTKVTGLFDERSQGENDIES